ncbi:platelet glycoprotein VI-like isoform X2 [Trichosurus vulpecula]|uniref:platelet glycoprotein VI-like isoform X2 n=1 Tax=Trichosurus vulpecula TaxID=9337 RepID=UPI00186B0617|nr:platelet glycoprotein VI-like isoform X2 [Trichosurus vulpecula]
MPGSLAALLCLGLCLSQSIMAQRDIAAETAGRYRCRYQRQDHWSELSDPLELMVTGLYPKPSISASPGTTVALGQDVTLHCESQLGSDKYVLYKTSGANAPHSLISTDYHATFPFPSVTDSHGGTYLCYSFDSEFPYLWSIPSDTLVLKISGGSPEKHLLHETPNYEYVSPYYNFRSLWLVVVGVTLAILGALTNEAWRHRGSAQQQEKKPVALLEEPEKQTGLGTEGPLEDPLKGP